MTVSPSPCGSVTATQRLRDALRTRVCATPGTTLLYRTQNAWYLLRADGYILEEYEGVRAVVSLERLPDEILCTLGPLEAWVPFDVTCRPEQDAAMFLLASEAGVRHWSFFLGSPYQHSPHLVPVHSTHASLKKEWVRLKPFQWYQASLRFTCTSPAPVLGALLGSCDCLLEHPPSSLYRVCVPRSFWSPLSLKESALMSASDPNVPSSSQDAGFLATLRRAWQRLFGTSASTPSEINAARAEEEEDALDEERSSYLDAEENAVTPDVSQERAIDTLEEDAPFPMDLAEPSLSVTKEAERVSLPAQGAEASYVSPPPPVSRAPDLPSSPSPSDAPQEGTPAPRRVQSGLRKKALVASAATVSTEELLPRRTSRRSRAVLTAPLVSASAPVVPEATASPSSEVKPSPRKRSRKNAEGDASGPKASRPRVRRTASSSSHESEQELLQIRLYRSPETERAVSFVTQEQDTAAVESVAEFSPKGADRPEDVVQVSSEDVPSSFVEEAPDASLKEEGVSTDTSSAPVSSDLEAPSQETEATLPVDEVPQSASQEDLLEEDSASEEPSSSVSTSSPSPEASQAEQEEVSLEAEKSDALSQSASSDTPQEFSPSEAGPSSVSGRPVLRRIRPSSTTC